jgi:Flp pilus assembly protein TadB
VRRRRVAWGEGPPQPLPKRPYRDTILVYLGLACTVVLVAWITGGDMSNAILIAAFFFVVATGWSFRVWRRKLREAEAQAAAKGRK